MEVDEKAGVATVGISDYAQNALGDVVYVELPSKGAALKKKGRRGTSGWVQLVLILCVLIHCGFVFRLEFHTAITHNIFVLGTRSANLLVFDSTSWRCRVGQGGIGRVRARCWNRP